MRGLAWSSVLLVFVGGCCGGGEPAAPSPEKLEQARAAQAAQKLRELQELEAFNSLSPAQHLEAATTALAQGYDEGARRGGDLALATKHLDTIQDTAAEHDQVKALETEVETRRRRDCRFNLGESRAALSKNDLAAASESLAKVGCDGAEAKQSAQLLKQVEQRRARLDRQDGVTLRIAWAAIMEPSFVEDIGANSARATGRESKTFTINYAGCNHVFMAMVMDESALVSSMRSLGFTKVECFSYSQGVYYDL